MTNKILQHIILSFITISISDVSINSMQQHMSAAAQNNAITCDDILKKYNPKPFKGNSSQLIECENSTCQTIDNTSVKYKDDIFNTLYSELGLSYQPDILMSTADFQILTDIDENMPSGFITISQRYFVKMIQTSGSYTYKVMEYNDEQHTIYYVFATKCETEDQKRQREIKKVHIDIRKKINSILNNEIKNEDTTTQQYKQYQRDILNYYRKYSMINNEHHTHDRQDGYQNCKNNYTYHRYIITKNLELISKSLNEIKEKSLNEINKEYQQKQCQNDNTNDNQSLELTSICEWIQNDNLPLEIQPIHDQVTQWIKEKNIPDNYIVDDIDQIDNINHQYLIYQNLSYISIILQSMNIFDHDEIYKKLRDIIKKIENSITEHYPIEKNVEQTEQTKISLKKFKYISQYRSISFYLNEILSSYQCANIINMLIDLYIKKQSQNPDAKSMQSE